MDQEVGTEAAAHGFEQPWRGGLLGRELSGGQGYPQGRESEAPNGEGHPLAAAWTAALSLS